MFDEEERPLNASHATDSRIQTAAHYLKSLHWCDKPTELMPADARWLTAARRFYGTLSLADQEAIDSFSDFELFRNMNKIQRDRRFNTLCRLYLETIETVPPKQTEKG